jgi:archaellum biogenesis ATPase FlaH
MSTHQDKTKPPLVVAIGEVMQDLCRSNGVRHVVDGSSPAALLDREGRIRHEIAFFGNFVILIPEGGESLRDNIALKLGDERCRWAYLPEDPAAIPAAVDGARPMWTDEIAGIDDIPEPGPQTVYKSGIDGIDRHGFRIVLPAFMPMIGPYGSGKSVLLRQLLVSLWRQHQWKFLLTAFEEKVKPKYQHHLRRHLIGKPIECWSEIDIRHADVELKAAAKFFLRKRNALLDLDRLLDRIEFAVRVYGVKVVAIDPVNEIDHVVLRDESKTDYMGRFIMRLKQIADDYGLLIIVCAHPPKDGVEKRLSRTGLLTLNDGADTAHWGNKADIGWCVWRSQLTGPTLLHIDKLKDHELMGEPTLAALSLNKALGCFEVTRVGYDILREEGE